MKSEEIKKLIAASLDAEADTSSAAGKLQDEGIGIDFSKNFTDRVIDRIFNTGLKVEREIEFARYLNFAFYRIALTGVAAIVILLISIFLAEGSFSLNTFLGISNNMNDESIVCMLTGN